jgi:hypothetical protein
MSNARIKFKFPIQFSNAKHTHDKITIMQNLCGLDIHFVLGIFHPRVHSLLTSHPSLILQYIMHKMLLQSPMSNKFN